MKNRVFSGLVLVLFCAAIVVFNNSFPLALNMVIALVSLLSVHELIKALGLTKHWVITIPSLLVAFGLPFCELDDGNLVIYAVYTATVFLALVWYHKDITFKEVAVVYSMVVMIPMALQTIVLVRGLSEKHGMFYALICVFAAWIPDAGAFFTGKLFGRHKLCPDISPKKTIEGFVGGIVVNIIMLVCIGLFFSHIYYAGAMHVNVLTLVVVGLFSALASVLGDLSFSLIKRSCNIKDFGNVIPGHGGILDRFDSVIFTAPLVYLIVRFLPLVP